MAGVIHAVHDGKDIDAFSDGSDVLNSNQAVFEPIDRHKVDDNWMQLWLVEDSVNMY